jgi:hypothetical protein
LYGNNSNGEKSTWFDFVMNIYELGNINWQIHKFLYN